MKKNQQSDKEVFYPLRFTWKGVILAYLCFTGLHLYIHNRIVDTPAIEIRQQLHKQVLEKKAPVPIQYRIMVYYISEFLQKHGVDFKASYLIVRGISLFLAALLFHAFLLNFFAHREAFVGIVLFFALLPQTYIHYYMQEMDLPNLVFYLSAFLIMLKRKDAWLFPLLFIAMFNRETPIFLPFIWLLFRWDELPFHVLALKFLGYCAVCFGVYAGLQKYFGYNASYAQLVCLDGNLKNINGYLGFFLLTGFLIYPACKGWSEKPKFLRRGLLFVPFFIMFNFTLTIFQESRLLLPIFLFLIPLAVASFAEPKPDALLPVQPVNGWIKKYSKLIYVCMAVIFIMLLFVIGIYGNKRFVQKYEKNQLASEYLRMGTESYTQKDYLKAAEYFQQGIRTEPNNYDLNYNIGILYYYQYNDQARGIMHFKRCLEIDPARHENASIKKLF